MRVLPIIALSLAAGACVPQTAPPPPAPTPVSAAPRPAPPVVTASSDWRDWPLTPGTWTYRRDDRGSLALFGTPNADARLTLRCDLSRRQVFLSVAGATATALTIRTSSTTRALAVQPTGGTPAYVAAALAPNDGLLDAMGFSRGRFVIQQAGGGTLVVPAWAEIERVTEDCRG
ncbi:hypothetical protein M9979_07945 [Sphingomonas sp. RP10(2022)]|uniref:Lipoprotein n=1 Tax=Sphingomonas liriopis TaxID=2949094 RepID=A0A9X2KQA7_9SPHN|nr:hypothetical protein [Sphingomonas liriopis]MCP3734800.1 hypothetical protein [Sphingomonas liriopis]